MTEVVVVTELVVTELVVTEFVVAAHGASHAASGFPVLDVAVVVASAAAVWFYLAGAHRPRRGGRWPVARSISWVTGIVLAAASVLLPAEVHGDFRTHMVAHVVLGMLSPLLLVLAAPVTLALRSLQLRQARRVSRILRSRPARVLAHPVTAALLSVGGAGVLYLTPVFAATQRSELLAAAVHVHVLASGYLFAAAIIGPDPNPHRAGLPQRATVLVLALAAHDVLAKHLYAHPPVGVAAVAAEEGSRIMYYAGSAVDVAIMVLLCAQWYATAGARHPLARAPQPDTMGR